MPKSWAGIAVTALILVGVVLIVALNLNTDPDRSKSGRADRPETAESSGQRPVVSAGFREYPIGDEVSKNHLTIRAVYLPAISMAGMEGSMDPEVIHLEADIVAEAGNPQGFTRDGFVPYLQVDYVIEPEGGGKPIDQGTMIPMVALDGLHYGANVSMPKAGQFRLTYKVSPPGKVLGRHSDPVTGVAAWWDPFAIQFEWDYPGPPAPIAVR